MRFAVFTTISALAAAVSAQSPNPFNVNGNIQITAGQPYTIKWNPTTQGPVSLKLREGASSALNAGTTIASGIDNSGSYTFTLPADTVRNSDYTIEISSDGNPSQVNYTPQFVVDSKNTVASQSGSTASASATATSSTTTSGSAKTTATSSSSASASTATSSKASSSMSSASATSSSSSSSASKSAAAAPTNAASNLQAQGGLAALLIGAAALL